MNINVIFPIFFAVAIVVFVAIARSKRVKKANYDERQLLARNTACKNSFFFLLIYCLFIVSRADYCISLIFIGRIPPYKCSLESFYLLHCLSLYVSSKTLIFLTYQNIILMLLSSFSHMVFWVSFICWTVLAKVKLLWITEYYRNSFCI